MNNNNYWIMKIIIKTPKPIWKGKYISKPTKLKKYKLKDNQKIA